MFCPNCETELPDGSKRCTKCGHDFQQKAKVPPSKRPSEDPLNDLGSTGGGSRDPLDGLATSLGSGPDVGSLRIGTVFADRYEILSEGLRGGMGVVYKVRDNKLNTIKALKLIHPRLLSVEEAVGRFRQEVSISQKLQHKNIVRVHDLDEYNGIEFFTMEWVDGKSLRENLIQRKKEKRPFTLEEAHKIISQLADALNHAHKFTVHRDIKPENVIISSDEEGMQIKLTDFGIAKMLTPSQFLSTSQQIGTPYYMAPEQKTDAASVDKRADIYAMGVLLFELLTLENTIGLEAPSEINKTLPKGIDEIVKKALATKPEDRYRDVREFSETLNQLVFKGVPKADEVKGAIERKAQLKEVGEQKIIREKNRNYIIKVSIGIVLILLIIIGVIYISSFKRDTPGTLMEPEPPKEVIKEETESFKVEKELDKDVIVKPKDQPLKPEKPPEINEKERRLIEFRSLINQSVALHQNKPNVAVVFDYMPTMGGLSPENTLVNLLKKEEVNIISHYFKKAFKTKGYFKEIYEGDTEILEQSGALSKVDYIIIGKINYKFKKGSEIDKDLVSCNLNFTYKVINKKGGIVKSDNINVVGPGFSEDAALSRGLEIMAEKYSDRILKSVL